MKKEKQYLLDEIQAQLQHSGSYIVAQYGAMSANKANEFRRHLAKVGGRFVVVKKRVFVKAAEKMGVSLSSDAFRGHIGLVLAGNEPVEVVKAVLRYSDENESLFSLLGGYVEGSTIGADDVKRIATLPSKDAMRAQFLGLLEAPMAGTLSVVEAVLTSVLHCINNREEQAK